MAVSSPVPGTAAETTTTGIARLIRKRQPGVLRSIPPDLSALTAWSDLDHLRSICGDIVVKVEPIDKARSQYGSGAARQEMRFGAFLDKLEVGVHLYLTTQYDGDDEDDDDDDDEGAGAGQEDDTDINPSSCFPGAVRSLLSSTDIPLVPACTPGLVLSSMNLWLGQSRSGASSGLHHDFHDNLYILLKGRKRFVLYPPGAAAHLRPHGTVEQVHKNGLIVYKDRDRDEDDGDDDSDIAGEVQGDIIRADGLSELDALRYRVKALERAKEALAVKGKGDKKERKKLEKEYEEAVEAMMEAQMNGLGDAGDDVDFEGEDDFDLLGDLDDLRDGCDSDRDSDGNGNDDEQKPKRRKLDAASVSAPAPASGPQAEAEAKGKAESTEPDSFSRIPAAQLHAYLGLRGSGSGSASASASVSSSSTSSGSSSSNGNIDVIVTPENKASLDAAGPPLVVHLCAGDALYLPASWWHEVTSFGSDNEEEDEEEGEHKEEGAEAEAAVKGKRKRTRDGYADGNGNDHGKKRSKSNRQGSNVHMAFNYWFHPPDRLKLPSKSASDSTLGKGKGESKDTGKGKGKNQDKGAGKGKAKDNSKSMDIGDGGGGDGLMYKDERVWRYIRDRVEEEYRAIRRSGSEA